MSGNSDNLTFSSIQFMQVLIPYPLRFLFSLKAAPEHHLNPFWMQYDGIKYPFRQNALIVFFGFRDEYGSHEYNLHFFCNTEDFLSCFTLKISAPSSNSRKSDPAGIIAVRQYFFTSALSKPSVCPFREKLTSSTAWSVFPLPPENTFSDFHFKSEVFLQPYYCPTSY